MAAVVLAAGGGRRFAGGSHKLLADYGGQPLVRWAIDAARAASLDETLVVTGAADLSGVLPTGVEVVHNSGWRQGLAGSVVIALAWCRARGLDAAVIGLGDCPGVEPSAWRAVAARPEPVAVACFAGRHRPPVRLAASVWGSLARHGDEGARGLWSRGGVAVFVACAGDPLDVDTVADLALARSARPFGREPSPMRERSRPGR